ncbi:MFS general substrate transporter [Viridothelium virens]|uniref:MFS general substrate transporter n=1 Tax=Viridothelium virens TaxID=1048519 RepID=A0A6A6GUZ5_VIRVR|nr:MFS general substrate transporter [Viridothelium virens]
MKTPIVFHYLTFDTILPSPGGRRTSDRHFVPLPEAPNLKRYDSPFAWSPSRKTFITWLSCISTAITAFTAGAYSPGIEQMMEHWNVSRVAASVGITTFTTGFAITPMFLAPFSEFNGRRPVFLVTGGMFAISQLCCALTPTYSGFLISRFVVGCSSSTFSTVVGGVVSDIYHAEDRNWAMTIFSGSALVGTGLGPFVGGFIAQHTSWRWIFYLQVILDGTLLVILFVFFRETRGSVLLSQKAKQLNQWYEVCEKVGYIDFDIQSGKDEDKKTSQRMRWKVRADEERGTLDQVIIVSLYRPFHLLFTEPVIFFFSFWVSFSWAVLYMTFAAIPLVFGTNHGFNLEQSHAPFAALSTGAILSTIISLVQENWARRRGKAVTSPEGRLYISCVQSALMPIGLFWFGWTSFPSIPWIVPTVAIGCATMGIFSIYLAVFNYFADTYHRYASSALAAQGCCRNLLGGVLPLVTTQMFQRLGFGGASSLLGGVGTLLTIVPWILVFYGPNIRARSKFAAELVDT